MTTLLDPFQFDFMLRAFLISFMVAVPIALLSAFLVLKGWSLMGDAISHAVLPGIVIAYVIGIPLAVGAFIAGMGCALLTGFIDGNSRVKLDTVMGVVFSAMFALGLVLYVAVETDIHLDHILFGDILGISGADLWQSGLIGGVVTAVIVIKWRDLLIHTFDAAHARSIGLPVNLLHYTLLILLSLTVVAALKAVGIILAIGMLIGPGAIAFLMVRSFLAMLLTSVLIAVLSSLVGVYLSFFLDSAPAPTIILVMTGIFLIVFTVTSFRQHAVETQP